MEETPILMPKLGLTMEEGVVSSWAVRPGDSVKAGDILFVVETDKIANEVEARGDGTIVEIKIPEGQTAPVGAVLATWFSAESNAEASSKTEETAVRTSVPRSTPASQIPIVKNGSHAKPAAAASNTAERARILATPLARRIARSARVKVETISGSGPRGRIRASDVELHIANSMEAAIVALTVPNGAKVRRAATMMEKTVARRLTESKQSIPHFYVMADADVTALLALRKDLNAQRLATKISINHCIIAALVKALSAMPEMNAIWQDEEILTSSTIDIGVAVDTSRGLLAPVVRDLGHLTLLELAVRADEVVERTRSGRLSSGDLEGGVMSVSNVGMFGVSFLTPIINPGQSAILGVGSPKKTFRPNAMNQPELREEIGLVLACDHRLHDGVRGAKLLNLIVEALAHPHRLLLT